MTVVALPLSFAACSAPDSAEKASELLQSDKIDEAIEILQRLVEKDAEDMKVQFLYGAALMRAGQYVACEWPLRKAMRDPDWLEPAGLLVATVALRTGNYEASFAPLDAILESIPDHVGALQLRAAAYVGSKTHIEEALEDVKRIREIDPGDTQSFRHEVLALLADGRGDEARSALEELGKRIGEENLEGEIDPWYCTTMALFAFEDGEIELAEERFETCLEYHPANLKTVNTALRFFDDQGRSERSLAILEHAIAETDPRVVTGLESNLAFRLAAFGRTEDAIAILTNVANVDDHFTAAAFLGELATLYDQQGRTQEALDSWEQSTQRSKQAGYQNPLQELAIADLAIRAGHLERAIEIAETLTLPAYQELIRGRVAQEQGRHEEALEHYGETAQLWPDNELARYHAARSAEALGQFDRAIELYRHTMRIARETTNAANRIAILRVAEGHPTSAYDLLRVHRGRTPLDEQGELLLMELTAQLEEPDDLQSTIEQAFGRGAAPAARLLARAFRGLRARGDTERVIEMMKSVRPEIYPGRGGAELLAELIRSEAPPEQLETLVDWLLASRPGSAPLIAVHGLLLETQGAADAARERYAAALRLDGEQPEALLGLARLDVTRAPREAARLAERALAASNREAARVAQVAALGSMLDAAGAHGAALELFSALVERVPYNGTAAEALARERLAQGDHSARTLDLARRAARFAKSRETLKLLSEVHAVQGDDGAAEQLSKDAEAFQEGA